MEVTTQLGERSHRPCLLQIPPLTQGSLADVCAGGSSDDELGVSADLLETNKQTEHGQHGAQEPQFPMGAYSPSSSCCSALRKVS